MLTMWLLYTMRHGIKVVRYFYDVRIMAGGLLYEKTEEDSNWRVIHCGIYEPDLSGMGNNNSGWI